MIKVLVVEDETVIRNGLMKHVPWEKLGVGTVKAAENATQAFEITETFRPDIIISDIRMPGIDGITLCRKLREKYQDCQIIFATGYSDKEYLKAAINLRAISYVEKPICVDSIALAIEEAVKHVTQNTKQKEAWLHSLLMDSENTGFDAGDDRCFSVQILHFKEEKDLRGRLEQLTEQLNEFLNQQELRVFSEIYNKDSLVFLFMGKNPMLPIRMAGEKIAEILSGTEDAALEKDTKWFLAGGKTVETTDKITESWQSALISLKCLFFRGWNQCVQAQENSHTIFERERQKPVWEQFTAAVTRKDPKEACEILERLRETLVRERILLNCDVRYLYYELNQILRRADQTFFPGELENLRREENSDFFDHAETLDEMHHYVKKHVRRTMTGTVESEEQKQNYLVKKVVDCILRQYANPDLSIKVLADKVGLTPSYLSGLFKKTTGETIGQYMVNIRVKHAQYLMEDPQKKFYEIAELVGYEDANYFAKIFKKKTGCTPSEYKEKLLLR
ncbi:MAG: response regulator [Lachnospiraceae bacterium]|nr:response regulator [Lachnospiraceae bacterium]